MLTLGIRTTAANETEHFFEQHIRPVLVERCHRCHAGEKHKGGLRLDSREALLAGGDSGAVVISGKPEESLLMQALRHQNGLAMPPDGRLSEPQVAAFGIWIQQGLAWPGSAKTTQPAPPVSGATPLTPNAGELATSLQIWLRADALTLGDGEPVHVWPDRSGHARDFSATRGVRQGGVGLPARFVKESNLFRRPAVRFATGSGLAASPDHPVDIRGDAALTMMLVVSLEPHEAQPPYDGILGIGNPAHAGDPGRPLAALVQINKGEDHALHFAGGWNHDASLGTGSFKPHYHKPLLLTITKQPGPMRANTRIYLNGEPATARGGEPPEGRDGVPDIQHRSDIGAYLGKALDWCGSIQGDIGEVLVYNRVLTEPERIGVECHLSEKYGLLARVENLAAPASFTPEEKSYWAWQPIRDEPPPNVNREGLVATPVDRFILQKLEERSLSFAPSADKRTLLRRIAFDLTGLPPTPEDAAAFLSDDKPGALERAVDRLLESPHYGEHWAQHWLDVVRYA
ncbi:MAG TPA: DUF1549 domain-containing protein, partial [Planctomycetaceae bacterium]|nr:DUF1549 domain-containing protein [Planctomycetaceae bacterium]